MTEREKPTGVFPNQEAKIFPRNTQKMREREKAVFLKFETKGCEGVNQVRAGVSGHENKTHLVGTC